MDIKPRRGQVRVGDIDVAYRVHGGGYPLLQVPGFGATMQTADRQFTRTLASEYLLITYDARGVGQTGPGTEQPSIETYARDAAGLLEALGVQRAHVLGISMGGCVAQELALAHPARVDNVVLMNTWSGRFPIEDTVMAALGDLSGTPRARAERLASLLFPVQWLIDHKKEMVKKLLRSSPPAHYDIASQEAAMRGWAGAEERLGSLRKWLMVVTGALDRVVPPGESQRTASLVPGSRLEVIPGAGHGAYYQLPEECAKLMTGFLT